MKAGATVVVLGSTLKAAPMPVPNHKEIVDFRREAPRLTRIKVKHDPIGRTGSLSPIVKSCVVRIGGGKPLRVLDIGAYDKALGKSLAANGLALAYHSVDKDEGYRHDFRDMDEVSDQYDLICMFELIEHLTLEEADSLLHRAYEHLDPGGGLCVSTPNPFDPIRFFGDITHRQHWPAPDLFAMLRHVGFSREQIQMYGLVFVGEFAMRRAPRILLDGARRMVWRALGLETRGGILAIATKT
jgi:SAM-dependent methyltransferase